MATLLADIHPTAPAPGLAAVAVQLPTSEERPTLRITTAGSVDDGKSTLIGRLLHDTNSVSDDQLEALRRSRLNRSSGPLDFSLLTDGLKAEREQGITIDVAYRHCATPRRRLLVADTPGHEQYTRNMATGASTADVAIVLVDARHGMTAQSRRHAYIAWLLGIRRLVITVNKMDLLGFDEQVFESVRAAWQELADWLPGACIDVLPVSALMGDNVTSRSPRTPWFKGPSLLELLEAIDVPAWDTTVQLRLAVQCVVRPGLEFRGYAGRIDSGQVRVGQQIQVLPSGKQSRVKRIVTFDGDLEEAFAPMAVNLVLEDELDISRGDWICGQADPPTVGSQFEATLVWMHEHPLGVGEQLLLQHGSTRVTAWVREILHRINPVTYQPDTSSQLALNEIGTVRLETARTLVFDRYAENRQTGSFVLIDPVDNFTLAAGMVERSAAPAPALRLATCGGLAAVAPAERRQQYGHGPAVVVSPSSAVLFALQRALLERRAITVLLQTLPPPALLRDLLANGLIVLAPSASPVDLDGIAWIEAVPEGPPKESARAVLREFERRGVQLSRDWVSVGEGI
jgi:sulfate adenylyltransferase large subunit